MIAPKHPAGSWALVLREINERTLLINRLTAGLLDACKSAYLIGETDVVRRKIDPDFLRPVIAELKSHLPAPSKRPANRPKCWPVNGQALRDYRRKARLTLERLSELSGVAVESLKRYEQSKPASPVHLSWVAKALGNTLKTEITVSHLIKD